MAVKPGAVNYQDAPQDNDTRNNEGRGGVDKDALRGRKAKDSTWFTALPQGIRKAMKSREKRALPRGFEERLRRYFESLD